MPEIIRSPARRLLEIQRHPEELWNLQGDSSSVVSIIEQQKRHLFTGSKSEQSARRPGCYTDTDGQTSIQAWTDRSVLFLVTCWN